MKNLAIIPARSGSKGLKDKNIKDLHGKPMMAYSIEAAIESGIFDEVFVSTDSEKYAALAKEYGASVLFLRDGVLATDSAKTLDVVRNVIEKYEDMGRLFDTVTILQPTSPLRTSNNIIEGFNIFKCKKANSVVSVCEVDHSPLWSNVLNEDMSLQDFIKKEHLNVPRQQLPTYYRINGALYIFRTDFIKSSDDVYGRHSFAYIMKKENSIDVDDLMDFKFVEFLLG